MTEPVDHEKNALVNMIQDGMGREIQLRAALSRAHMELAQARQEIAALSAERSEPAAADAPAGEADEPISARTKRS